MAEMGAGLFTEPGLATALTLPVGLGRQSHQSGTFPVQWGDMACPEESHIQRGRPSPTLSLMGRHSFCPGGDPSLMEEIYPHPQRIVQPDGGDLQAEVGDESFGLGRYQCKRGDRTPNQEETS